MKKIFMLFLLVWGSMAGFAQPTDFNYYKSLGLVQYYEKDFLQAIFNLQKATTLKPSDKDVTSYLKMCYDSVGSKDLAAKMRMKMEKFGTPVDNRPAVKPAMAADAGQAVNGIQKKNIARPKAANASEAAGDLRQLGDYFMNRESYDSAALCYQHYVKVYPADSSVLFYLATCQYFLKQYDEAISNYELALRKEPKRADLYNWIGVCELLNGNYLSARDNFKQCIKLDVDYSLAYFNLGKTQYELEDYGDAAKNLEKARELMHDDPDIIKMLADIYYNTGKWDKAKAMYESIYLTSHKNERANYRLGEIYLKLGQWDKAVTYLENFTELAPNTAEAYKKLGIAYYNLEKYTFAINNFEKATKTLWDDKELMLYGAIASNKLGNYSKAIDFATRAVTLDKNYSRGYFELGTAYKGMGDKKLSKENFAKAKDLEMNAVNAGESK